MIKKIHFSLLCFCILIGFKLQANFFEENAKGWHWYDVVLLELKSADIEKLKEPTNEALTPTEQIKAYSKLLEEKLHHAWVNPSIANIMAYQEMQKDLMQRSDHFSRIWMQALYLNPQLDHTLVFPVNQKGRHIYLDQQKIAFNSTLQNLKNTHGLFFFFRGNCPYCEAFAPIVQQFSADSGWEVLAISLDGHKISGFKHLILDNGLSRKLKITVLPALFAVNFAMEQILPVALGLSSLDEIETRIMNLVEKQNFRG